MLFNITVLLPLFSFASHVQLKSEFLHSTGYQNLFLLGIIKYLKFIKQKVIVLFIFVYFFFCLYTFINF